jgi:heparanase 1
VGGLHSWWLCESFICRVIVTFGLNALYGRHQIRRRGAWEGDWDPSNTIDLMKYTISKGYQINSWEFGMEQ